MKYLISLFFIFSVSYATAQTVYKTPSASKYHTATCRYVKNVSNGMTVAQAEKIGLSACTQCKPNNSQALGLVGSNPANNKGLGIKRGEAQGASQKSTQCKGITKKGQRCKRITRNVNGYCHQHE